MISGYMLAANGNENTACWKAGLDSTTGLELVGVPCPNEGGKLLSIEWATPCSEDGVSVTGFDYAKATDSTKPRADSVKTIAVQDLKNGGGYKRIIVIDAFTEADYITSCCTGCDPVAAVTVPAPLFFNGDCTLAAPTLPACVYAGAIVLPPLTLTNFIATAYGYKADGTAIVFAPSTSTGTTATLLAADMQTNWASELGTGTFVATGNVIDFTSTNGARVAFVITQS